MRAILLVVSGLVLAVALWLLAGEWSEPAAPAGPEPVVESPLLEAAAAEPGAAATEPPPEEAPAARTELASPPPVELGEGQVAYRVRVVHATSEEPVAGAVVSWLPPGFDYSAVPKDEMQRLRDDKEAFVAEFGESRTADAQGRVSIPGPPGGVGVSGRAGSLYGVAYLRILEGDQKEVRPEDLQREFVLELAEDLTLLARAVDLGGGPVPGVKIKMEVAGQRQFGNILQPTNEDGLTRLRHVQRQLGPAQTFSLEPTLFGGAGEPTAARREELAAGPIDVPLPAFGSLEVVLLGPDGGPWELAEGTDTSGTTAPFAGRWVSTPSGSGSPSRWLGWTNEGSARIKRQR